MKKLPAWMIAELEKEKLAEVHREVACAAYLWLPNEVGPYGERREEPKKEEVVVWLK